MRWAPLLFSICAVAAAAEPATEFDAGEQDAIREAVLRDMFKRADSICYTIFLNFDGEKTSSDAVIARLVDTELRFRKASEAEERNATSGGWVYFDRKTGEPGVMVFLGCIRRTVRGRAEIQTHHYTNGLNGFGDTCVLEKKSGKWVVVKKKGHFAS